jgi:uncharacterized protein (TIGR02246 family)
MFERYTEKARRVIFFARYEAGQYGSAYIETEHILLGLLREDRALMEKVLGLADAGAQVRADIEREIKRGKLISTSVEVPLTQESKKVLQLAAGEATALAHRYIGPEHLLLGLLGEKGSRAARILEKRGVNPAIVREQLASSASSRGTRLDTALGNDDANATLGMFLAALEAGDSANPFLFAEDVQFIDGAGKRWKGRHEIEKHWETLFTAYAKRKAACVLESSETGPAGSVVTSVLWENLIVAGESRRSMHRMTFLVSQVGTDWLIFLIQVTPVIAT